MSFWIKKSPESFVRSIFKFLTENNNLLPMFRKTRSVTWHYQKEFGFFNFFMFIVLAHLEDRPNFILDNLGSCLKNVDFYKWVLRDYSNFPANSISPRKKPGFCERGLSSWQRRGRSNLSQIFIRLKNVERIYLFFTFSLYLFFVFCGPLLAVRYSVLPITKLDESRFLGNGFHFFKFFV
jgi:hypothetical protein